MIRYIRKICHRSEVQIAKSIPRVMIQHHWSSLMVLNGCPHHVYFSSHFTPTKDTCNFIIHHCLTEVYGHMSQLVTFQISFLVKSFPTNTTTERLLSCMNHHVCLQIGLLWEILPTYLAGKLLLGLFHETTQI